jgi:hypothetical protein
MQESHKSARDMRRPMLSMFAMQAIRMVIVQRLAISHLSSNIVRSCDAKTSSMSVTIAITTTPCLDKSPMGKLRMQKTQTSDCRALESSLYASSDLQLAPIQFHGHSGTAEITIVEAMRLCKR